MSADQKFTRSNYYIAELYRHGNGVEQDPQKTIEHYLKAKNDKEVQFELGIIYLEGKGSVESNRDKALEFFNMSLKNRSEEANKYINKLTGRIQTQRKPSTEKIPYTKKSLLDISSVEVESELSLVKPENFKSEFSIEKNGGHD